MYFYCGDGWFAVIEKEKLARLVKREIDNQCQLWREDLPFLAHLASSPPMSIHAIRNTRRKMEDRHVVLPHVQHLLRNVVSTTSSVQLNECMLCIVIIFTTRTLFRIF